MTSLAKVDNVKDVLNIKKRAMAQMHKKKETKIQAYIRVMTGER